MNAREILDRHYLEIRCGLLDLAAALDRIDRTHDSSTVSSDERMQLIHEALSILDSDGPDRAERIQLLFSDEYHPGWFSRTR